MAWWPQSRALVLMAAERGRAAALDGGEHLAGAGLSASDRFFSMKLLPSARMMSATSKGRPVHLAGFSPRRFASQL